MIRFLTLLSSWSGVALLALAPACGTGDQPAPGPANVDGSRLVFADREPENWMAHGRTYDEQRFSPLEQIDSRNVARLGLAWSYKIEIDRGLEATPIVVDGVLYTTGPFSIVKGSLRRLGMPDFSEKLEDGEIELIRQFIIRRSLDLRRGQ